MSLDNIIIVPTGRYEILKTEYDVCVYSVRDFKIEAFKAQIFYGLLIINW